MFLATLKVHQLSNTLNLIPRKALFLDHIARSLKSKQQEVGHDIIPKTVATLQQTFKKVSST